MLAIFDVDRTAELDSRHAAALDRLAHEFAIDQRQHVDRLIEADADLALVGPIDRAGLALAIAKFDRDLASRGRSLIGHQGGAERRNLADRARDARAGIDQHAGIELALLMGKRRLVRPGEPVSHDENGVRGRFGHC